MSLQSPSLGGGKFRELLTGNLPLSHLNPLRKAKEIYRYEPLTDYPNHTRLLLLHPGKKSDPLHLELLAKPVPLDDPDSTPYEALSYVWGSENELDTINFGPGARWGMPITLKLAEALAHLRYTDKPRTLWIDALCINQSDDAERSAQVAVMAQIFHNAKRVIAWLGPEADDSNRALEVLDEIGSQVDVQWGTYTMAPSPTARNRTIGDMSRPLPYSESDGDAVNSLFLRPWFERLWIRQEVSMAQTVVMRAGMREASWENFRKAVACIRMKPRNSYPTHKLERSRFRLVYNVCRPLEYYKVVELYRRIRGAKCKDPRDRIYAILSLLLKSNPHLTITPDYTLSVKDIYRDVVIQDIKSARNLSILVPCRYSEKDNEHKLPSWVPNWAVDRSVGLDSPSLAGDLFHPTFEYKGGDVLSVMGVQCATVTRSRAINEPVSRGQLLEQIQTTYRELLAHKNNVSGARTGGRSQYIAGGSVVDALCRTLFVNRFSENFMGSGTNLPVFGELRKQFAEYLDADIHMVESGKEYDFINNHQVVMRRGTLIVTSDGHVGCGPKKARAGDVMVIVLGCREMMMLRPAKGEDQKGKYHVIGECYLHGAMAAEPLLGPLPEGTRQILSDEWGSLGVGFLDDASGKISQRDPRMERIVGSRELEGFDVSGRLEVSRDTWRKAGVEASMFDLI
jgi:hypothetical protein